MSKKQRTRKIGGRTFHEESSYATKKIADKVADAKRTRGKLVRRIKIQGKHVLFTREGTAPYRKADRKASLKVTLANVCPYRR